MFLLIKNKFLLYFLNFISIIFKIKLIFLKDNIDNCKSIIKILQNKDLNRNLYPI